MSKRPHRQGQTLWMAWTQVDAKGEKEITVKPLTVVSCLLDHDPDYGIGEWITIVRFQGVIDQKGIPRTVETSLSGIYTHKTYRTAQRTVNEWNAQRERHRAQREAELKFGAIQEIY